jgi:hypothetical protein
MASIVGAATLGASCTPGDTGGDETGEDGGSEPSGGVEPRANVDQEAPEFGGPKSADAVGARSIAVAWDAATDNRTQQGSIAYRIYVTAVPVEG